MIETQLNQRETGPTLLGVLLAGEAIACLVIAAAHVGHPIPLGFAVLQTPRLLPATVAEALCGIVLAAGSVGLLARRSWVWPMALGAQIFSLLAFIIGVFATAGRGADDPVNYVFHRVMLGLFVAGLLATAVMRRHDRHERVETSDDHAAA